MRRLDGLSAFMVYNEGPNCYQHTLKIAIIEWGKPEEYSFDFFRQRFQQGVQIFPVLKWKLKKVPLGVNRPVWVWDQDFDLSHHVKRIACPKPGDKKTFCELVSELYAQPLDKSMPLWQVWIIEELEGGRVAMVCMFHHAYTDGAGASVLMQALFDPENCKPLQSIDLGVDPAESPTRLRLLTRGLVELPTLLVTSLPKLVGAIIKSHRLRKQFIVSGRELPADISQAPSFSPLNTNYSPSRTFTFLDFSFEEFKAISRSLGVTINDLLVAVIAGAVRRFLKQQDYPLDHPLIAGIPVNMRTEEEKYQVVGNYVVNSYMVLPIDIDDPQKRVEVVSASGRAMKDYIKATGRPWYIIGMEFVTPIVVDFLNWLLRRSQGQFRFAGNILVSNVRGPEKPMDFVGGKVVNWLSIGQVVLGLGVNVTAWSYADKVSICLMAEKKVIPDGKQFIDYISDSFAEYRQIYLQREPDMQRATG